MGGLHVGVTPIMLAMGGNATHSRALPPSLVERGVWIGVTPLITSAGTGYW